MILGNYSISGYWWPSLLSNEEDSYVHGLVGTEEPIVPVFELQLDLSCLAPTVLDLLLTERRSSSFGSGHTDYHSFVEYQTFKLHSTVQAHDAAHDILQLTGNSMCSYITFPFLLVLEDSDPMEHDSQPHR